MHVFQTPFHLSIFFLFFFQCFALSRTKTVYFYFLLSSLSPFPPFTGNYVILLSTGLSWYSALIFNFMSALSAIIGFFIVVAIGTESEEVNSWILAFAAGLFIYIALVDLVRRTFQGLASQVLVTA